MSRNRVPVVDTTRSEYTRLRTVPLQAVQLGDGFWQPWRTGNRDRALLSFYHELEAHGVLDNFRRVSGRKDCPRQGFYWTDSDLYKWLEAAAWSFVETPAKPLREAFDTAVDEILAAQGKDGYVNTYFVDREHDDRFTRRGASHEFYCLGHLLEAGLALRRTTGETQLLKAARRFVDYLLGVFGPNKRKEKADHPELEIALIELYRETQESKYLEFAAWLLEQLDCFRENEITGHAVCTTYACTAAANLVAETGEETWRLALARLWEDMVERRMYLTGGIGVRYFREDFGHPYQLPAQYGYAETCAAIGSLLWNWRLLLLEGDVRYADLLERILYNGLLAGVGLSADTYFYENPLASFGEYQRALWHNCTCCPPNMQRLLATLPGYFFTTSDEGLWVHLYDSCMLEWGLEDGTALQVDMQTGYPRQGDIKLKLKPRKPVEFTLFLRIPAWCEDATVRVNRQADVQQPMAGSYYAIRRTWNDGDEVELHLPLEPRVVVASPNVRDMPGCAAVERGPLVYCAESVDNPRLASARLVLGGHNPHNQLDEVDAPDLLGGVCVLQAPGEAVEPEACPDALYFPLDQLEQEPAPCDLRLIPYYAWANRGASQMAVWLPWTSPA